MAKMAIEGITFEQLAKECNLETSELRNILKRRSDIPQIKIKGLISRKDANLIKRKLTGSNIDWRKYEIEAWDSQDDGPLAWNESQEIVKYVVDCFNELDTKVKEKQRVNFRIMGMACRGGYLSGKNNPDFIVSFDKGINCLIGDRGSGKSTILNLIGAFSDSVEEETQILVKRLLSVFSSTGQDSPIANLNRRVHKVMKRYGVEKYLLFYERDGNVYSYYANRKSATYCVLQNESGEWKPERTENNPTQSSILFLSQGEVIRIAEDREQKHYLNSILDSIFPDIFEDRKKFSEKVNEFLSQFRHFNLETNPIISSTKTFPQFISQISKDLTDMQNDINRNRTFNESHKNRIEFFLRNYEYYRNEQPYQFWKSKTIKEYFNEGEPAFYYLLIGRYYKFVLEKLNRISELKAERQPNRKTTASSEIKDAEDINAEEEKLEELDIAEISQDGNDTSTFLSAIKDLEATEIDEEVSIILEIIKILQNQVIRNRTLYNIYTKKIYTYEEKLRSLIRKYLEIMMMQSTLIKKQVEKCEVISGLVSKDANIRIQTVDYQNKLKDISSKIEEYERLENLYNEFINAKPDQRIRDIVRLRDKYQNLVNQMIEEITYINDQIEKENLEFFIFPLKVELLQGNIYRTFDELSFGQKSGIILKIVLTATKRCVIMIDQPEDNLDIYSIINIISPTLRTLKELDKRQIILVTHNSNLIMASGTNRLIVLESRGDIGVDKFQGSASERQAVKEIFEILEGGLSTFSQKIRNYEDFIEKSKNVDDWDIHLIESSFRQRTIDGLRNFLQPIINDRSMLAFLRHQLKQSDLGQLKNGLNRVKKSIKEFQGNKDKGYDEVLDLLESLIKMLDSHINNFMDAIQQIGLMDTQPKIEIVKIYPLLKELEESVINKLIRNNRKILISIDSRLEPVQVMADSNHLRLVFTNLFENSLRATEAYAIRERKKSDYVETIKIDYLSEDNNFVQIIYSDNGCGINEDIRSKLYKEPVSTKPGKEHGLGGVIIRKLLEINHGSITLMETNTNLKPTGLSQIISLCKKMEIYS